MWSTPLPETWTWPIIRASRRVRAATAYYPADDLNTYLVMAGRPLYAPPEDLPGTWMNRTSRKGCARWRSSVIYQDQVIAWYQHGLPPHEEAPATARAALRLWRPRW